MKFPASLPLRRLAASAVVATAAGLLGACTTTYAPMGYAGGYRDTRVTDSSYVVEFSGNGNTSKEAVWNYWIYRCADLTQQKGFAYFSIEPKAGRADAGDADASLRLARHDDADVSEWVELKGAGAGTTYVYVPGGGGTVTTWHSKATILMFKTATEPGARFSLDAKAVTEALKPFIASQGRGGALTAEDIVRKAMTLPASQADIRPPAVPWSGGSGGRVEMKDLDGLLPK